MIKKLNNPFVITGYHSPMYFCDREKETEKLIEALSNNRNVTLISPRRMGKKGLIHHVFHQLSAQNRNTICFYIDIFSTQNLNSFANLFGKTVVGKLDDFSKKMINKLSAFFKSFRPLFTFDATTGEPSISLSIQQDETEQSLQEIFEYLNSSQKNIYIAIDEFQQITQYPEKGVEALLRSYIQFLPNVHFIFAGSKTHLMNEMFSSVHRPFYQSTQKIGLKELPMDTYRNFAVHLFNEYNKTLDPILFDWIYQKMFGHTWYIQLILNHLFASKLPEYSEQTVNEIVNDILEEENATYKTYCEIISKGQLRLLKSIAIERKVAAPFEQSFMKKHHLSAPSSVKLSLKSLIDKTLIIKDENGFYSVYDRFFSLWLAQNGHQNSRIHS